MRPKFVKERTYFIKREPMILNSTAGRVLQFTKLDLSRKVDLVCFDEGLKARANGRSKCQQLPALLGVVGQQCCVRLHGPKSLTGFKLYTASANKCQHCCGSMQTDATSHNIVGPNNVGCCWPTMLGPFAWALALETLAMHQTSRAKNIIHQPLLIKPHFRLTRQGRK